MASIFVAFGEASYRQRWYPGHIDISMAYGELYMYKLKSENRAILITHNREVINGKFDLS
jgi:hypothetical protein